MFTGLVEGLGEIEGITRKGPDAQLVIKPCWNPDETVLGESIAVNGACLTATGKNDRNFTADASAETLSRTILGLLKPGRLVNLERAMKLGDRLGGHLVSGHVDCVGRIRSMENLGSSVRFAIEMPSEHMAFVVEKGSVCLSGVSLTVNEVQDTVFTINIIPHTMQETTLKLAKQGDSVNIETDLIGKYVARLLNPGRKEEPVTSGLGKDDLIRMGF